MLKYITTTMLVIMLLVLVLLMIKTGFDNPVNLVITLLMVTGTIYSINLIMKER